MIFFKYLRKIEPIDPISIPNNKKIKNMKTKCNRRKIFLIIRRLRKSKKIKKV
jgi:hypothetical protein